MIIDLSVAPAVGPRPRGFHAKKGSGKRTGRLGESDRVSKFFNTFGVREIVLWEKRSFLILEKVNPLEIQESKTKS